MAEITLTETQAELCALESLQISPDLPDLLEASGVDAYTVGQITDAIDLAYVAIDARTRAEAAEAQARAVESDNGPAAAAAAWAYANTLRATADALAADTADAALQARDDMNAKHTPVAEAISGAGGSHQVAAVAWYDGL